MVLDASSIAGCHVNMVSVSHSLEFNDLLQRLERVAGQLRGDIRRAVSIADDDPEMALVRARKVLEYVVRDLYQRHFKEPPGTRPLENLLQRLVKEEFFPIRLDAYANTVRKLGNVDTHSFDQPVTAADVYQSLTQLLPILEWYFEFARPGSGSADSHNAVPTSTSAPILREAARASDDSTKPIVVPKGLRSFDVNDANFFLTLLPGPRDRDGLPDSIRFWKQQIEAQDEPTFTIGLLYGPSGCGKSSLLKAGLIPRLADRVLVVFVEATPEDTESRLLDRLRAKCPDLDRSLNLVESIGALGMGQGLPGGRKLLIVLDQFEQWLHARREDENAELTVALRQCDGRHVQSIFTVRDDFWLAVSRFMQALKIDLVQGQNAAMVDLFDLLHARKVLTAFGQSFGRLLDEQKIHTEQDQFLDKAIAGLAQEGKVVPVQLALFAEMVKGKPWTLGTLKEIGGVAGVGVSFLSETFDSRTANPQHRQYQNEARSVLKALLPEQGTDIKGHMRSQSVLCAAAGFNQQQIDDFDALLKILDIELRLITPTDPQSRQGRPARRAAESKPGKMAGTGGSLSSPSQATEKYYQLTHDYLVPSLREWLTRKQRETRRGRAELCLAERSALWNAKPENRHLPSTLEWLRIVTLTRRTDWTAVQRNMMQQATRVKGLFWSGVCAFLLLTGIGVQQIFARIEHATAQTNTKVAVDSLQAARGYAVPFVLDKLGELPRELVLKEMVHRFPSASGQQKLSLAYGLAHLGQVEVGAIVDGLRDENTLGEEMPNIVRGLSAGKTHAIETLRSVAEDATNNQQWQEKTRVAVAAMYLDDLSIATDMLRAFPERRALPELILPDLLQDFRNQLDQISQLSPDEQSADQARLDRARANFYLDQTEKALTDLTELASNESAAAEVFLLLAVCQARNGNEDESAAALARLDAKTSLKSYVWFGRILSQAWLGKLEEAFQLVEQLVAEAPDDATTHYNAACIAAQLSLLPLNRDLPVEEKLKLRAVQLLRRAYKDLDFDGNAQLDQDADLVPLHNDPGFQQLVREIKPPTIAWDPIERTTFISDFPSCSGDIALLAEKLNALSDAGLRSGLCLALGGVERPEPTVKDAWGPTLVDWYVHARDGGTHSAVHWALTQWDLPMPALDETPAPSDDRDWWHAPGLRFVAIPAGNVTGEVGPIVVSNDFWLGDCEITVELFQSFVDDKDYSGLKPENWEGTHVFDGDKDPGLPVQRVSWFDAAMFCNWLSWKLGLDPRYEIARQENKDERDLAYAVKFLATDGIRLPTEAEWEYACRGETTTAFGFGDDETLLDQYGWFAGNGNSRTHIVASKRCNGWGLFDMHGNVWEWCESAEGSVRVNRGGRWGHVVAIGRSAFRYYIDPSFRFTNLGFRLARGPSSQVSESVSEGR